MAKIQTRRSISVRGATCRHLLAVRGAQSTSDFVEDAIAAWCMTKGLALPPDRTRAVLPQRKPAESRPPVDDAERDGVSAEDDLPACGQRGPGGRFGCSRGEGHQGDHVASDGTRVLERWPQEAPTASPSREDRLALLRQRQAALRGAR